MKIISTKDVVNITNGFYGKSYKNYKALTEDMTVVRKRLHDEWLASLDKSGGADDDPAYSVYNDPDYNYEAIHCFEKSKAGSRECIQYMTKAIVGKSGKSYNGPLPADAKILDLYNGNGLTTVHMNMNGFNVESFNDCQPQIEYMQLASKMLTGTEVTNHLTMPTEQYDCVMTFEVMEHYSEPLVHLTDLLKLVKPGGYLMESSGFNGKVDNIGHFDSYRMFDWKMSYVKARQLLTKVMRHYFDMEHAGFNAVPRMWRRNDFNGPYAQKMMIGKCWEMHPMHYGSGSKVYCNHNGDVMQGDVDQLMDIVNAKLTKEGKPTLFEDPKIFACCAGPWPEFVNLGKMQ